MINEFITCKFNSENRKVRDYLNLFAFLLSFIGDENPCDMYYMTHPLNFIHCQQIGHLSTLEIYTYCPAALLEEDA